MWRTGVVPWHIVPRDPSPLLTQNISFQPPGPTLTDATTVVYTDGSGKRHAGALIASYGVHFPVWPSLDTFQGLPWRLQSVQRAEVAAVCKAIEISPGPLCVITDSQYVRSGLERRRAKQYPGTNSDLWDYIFAHRQRITSVKWIKAHIPTENLALAKGFSAADWQGKRPC